VGEQLRIGELGARLGLSTPTLRYYESVGLLGEPERSPSGYRLYDEDDEERVRFILRAKALDLSLDEIRSLLQLWRGGGCGDTRTSLRHLVAHKIQEARTRASEAEAFAAQLTHVYARLGEEMTPGAERCGCIPELPAAGEVDLDAELARIQGSLCGCGAQLDEVPAAAERACACGCCAPDASQTLQIRTTTREEVTTP
jgi:DNA-binding transcriptional MerR regulator